VQSYEPWRLRQRWYEERKRTVLLSALPRKIYGDGFEPGCGSGELTLNLAPRCESLLASDFCADSVGAARRKLAHASHVRIEQQVLPYEWPAGRFDLIVIGDWACYLCRTDFQELVDRSASSLSERGNLVVCHDLPLFGGRIRSIDSVQSAFGSIPGWGRQVRHEENGFLLEIWGLQSNR
jgi:SAM-dependent methyltransferase